MVDEVLAVGDAAFQQKCLGKMGDVAKEGRTVLFVSHNMVAVSNLCSRAVCLNDGTVVNVADTRAAVSKYLQLISSTSRGTSSLNLLDRSGKGPIRFTSFRCELDSGDHVVCVVSGQEVKFVLGYTSEQPSRSKQLEVSEVSIVVYSADGNRLSNLSSLYFPSTGFRQIPGEGSLVCVIPKLPLRAGHYMVDLYCEVKGQTSDWIRSAATFDVEDGDFYGSGRTTRAYTGSVFFEHRWELG